MSHAFSVAGETGPVDVIGLLALPGRPISRQRLNEAMSPRPSRAAWRANANECRLPAAGRWRPPLPSRKPSQFPQPGCDQVRAPCGL